MAETLAEFIEKNMADLAEKINVDSKLLVQLVQTGVINYYGMDKITAKAVSYDQAVELLRQLMLKTTVELPHIIAAFKSTNQSPVVCILESFTPKPQYSTSTSIELKIPPLWLHMEDPCLPIFAREQEIVDILQRIKNTVAKVAQDCISVITGEPGIGKTELVRQIWLKSQSEPKKTWIWIDAAQRNCMLDVFRELARTFQIPFPTAQSFGNLKDAIHEIYGKLCKNECYIVFDGAEAFKGHLDSIYDFLPKHLDSKWCKLVILVTSTNRNWQEIYRFDLKCLSKLACLEYANKRFNTKINDEEVASTLLYKLSGGLPLTLNIILDYILAAIDESPPEFSSNIKYFLEEFSNADVLAIERKSLSFAKLQNVLKVLLGKVVEDRSVGKLSMRVLLYASFLPTNNIRYEFLQHFISNKNDFGAAIARLIKYSLLSKKKLHYEMNRLTQQVIIHNFCQKQKSFFQDSIDFESELTEFERNFKALRMENILQLVKFGNFNKHTTDDLRVIYAPHEANFYLEILEKLKNAEEPQLLRVIEHALDIFFKNEKANYSWEALCFVAGSAYPEFPSTPILDNLLTYPSIRKLNDGVQKLYALLIQIYFQNGYYTKALQLCRDTLRPVQSQELDLTLLFCRSLIKNGEYTEGIAFIQSILKKNKDLGIFKSKSKCKALAPNDILTLKYFQAKCHYSLKNYPKSLQLIKKIEMRTNDAEKRVGIMIDKAYVLLGMGKVDEAVKIFVEKYPNIEWKFLMVVEAECEETNPIQVCCFYPESDDSGLYFKLVSQYSKSQINLQIFVKSTNRWEKSGEFQCNDLKNSVFFVSICGNEVNVTLPADLKNSFNVKPPNSMLRNPLGFELSYTSADLKLMAKDSMKSSIFPVVTRNYEIGLNCVYAVLKSHPLDGFDKEATMYVHGTDKYFAGINCARIYKMPVLHFYVEQTDCQKVNPQLVRFVQVDPKGFLKIRDQFNASSCKFDASQLESPFYLHVPDGVRLELTNLNIVKGFVSDSFASFMQLVHKLNVVLRQVQ